MSECKTALTGLNQENMQAVFRRRAKELAWRKARMLNKDRGLPVVVFSIDQEHYAVALEDLSSVEPYGHCTPMPKSDPMICGVTNIRGELCCVIDLGALMGLGSPEKSGGTGYILNLRYTDLALKVNRIDQIMRFYEADQSKSDMDNGRLPAKYSKGLFKGHIILLDVQKILSHPIFSKQ